MSSDKERMLELSVISFWFHQTALFDVDHLPESICIKVHSENRRLNTSWQLKLYLASGHQLSDGKKLLVIFVLTHVELPNEAGHVVVFEELWENLFGEPALIKHMEAGSALNQNTEKQQCGKCSALLYLISSQRVFSLLLIYSLSHTH